ncbi:MAG: hypothetical protein AAB368_14435, partial [bacterium]
AGVSPRRSRDFEDVAGEVKTGVIPAADYAVLSGLFQTGPLGFGAAFRLASQEYGAPRDTFHDAGSDADKVFDVGLAYVLRGDVVGLTYRSLGSHALAADLALGGVLDGVAGTPLTLTAEWHFPAERGGVAYGGAGAAWPLPAGVALRVGGASARKRAYGTAGVGWMRGAWSADYAIQVGSGSVLTHAFGLGWSR